MDIHTGSLDPKYSAEIPEGIEHAVMRAIELGDEYRTELPFDRTCCTAPYLVSLMARLKAAYPDVEWAYHVGSCLHVSIAGPECAFVSMLEPEADAGPTLLITYN